MRTLTSLAAVLALGAAPAVSVVVNDQPLHVRAISHDGRVLVPMRAIFEALGAGVVYDRGEITAKRGDRTIALRVGERAVTVDGRSETLDVPAEIHGSTAFVPLRVVSASLGASVDYDASERIVTVDLHGAPAAATTAVRPVATLPPGELIPAPQARANTAYPSIGAQLSGATNVRNVHMTIDGVDVTSLLSVAGGSFLYIPQNGLSVGTHVVDVSGYNGTLPFAQQWTFDTTQPPAPVTGYQGPDSTGVYNGGPYSGFSPLPLQQQMQLYVDGNNFGPGSWIDIHLTAVPNGSAYAFACTASWSYPMYSAPNSPFYNASIQIPNNLTVPRCPIIAEFVDQYGNVTYAPYPVFVSIFSPQATAVPQPTPTPSPAPIPHPTNPRVSPTPHPTPRSPWRPIVTPTATPMGPVLPHIVRTAHPLATPAVTATPLVLPHEVRTAAPAHTAPPHTPVPKVTEPPA